MTTATPTASPIASNADARRVVGKLVQVRGTVQREKLGDTVNTGDLSVRCINFRFPDSIVGQSVTAEGTLDIVYDEPAVTNAAGEISQGAAEGSSSFALRGCVAK